MFNILYNLLVAFGFGATNALIISLASSKGIEQGFLDALLGNLKKVIFLISIIVFFMGIYLSGFSLTSTLILIVIINTIIFGIYFGRKWRIPTNTQLTILQLSGFVSLVLWYGVAILTFS